MTPCDYNDEKNNHNINDDLQINRKEDKFICSFNRETVKEHMSESSLKSEFIGYKDSLKRFFISRKEFFHFYNKILNCKVLFSRKDYIKVNTKDEHLTKKGSLDDSIEIIRCCICFENRNDIILDCSVI